jgi:hypothetical protein
MELKHCVNSFIADRAQMPRWGQLGCNGFIMLSSGEQRVLEAATSPFMQVRDLAFRHVEAVLDSELAGQASAAPAPARTQNKMENGEKRAKMSQNSRGRGLWGPWRGRARRRGIGGALPLPLEGRRPS